MAGATPGDDRFRKGRWAARTTTTACAEARGGETPTDSQLEEVTTDPHCYPPVTTVYDSGPTAVKR